MSSRITSRDGVNAARTFFEHHGCTFQEIGQQHDFGKDAYIDVADDRKITHLCVALQIKSGASYRAAAGDYLIPVDNHADLWRRSTVPVFGIVYDPNDRESAGLTLLDTFALILSRRAEVFRFPVATVSMRAAWMEHSRIR
jgi:hypothetical protein